MFQLHGQFSELCQLHRLFSDLNTQGSVAVYLSMRLQSVQNHSDSSHLRQLSNRMLGLHFGSGLYRVQLRLLPRRQQLPSVHACLRHLRFSSHVFDVS